MIRLHRSFLVPGAALGFIAGGALLWFFPAWSFAAQPVWLAGLILTGLPVVVRTLRGMLRGHFAADVVAMLAVITAVLLNEPLAGLIVVLMQTGGEALERYAERRASDAVRELEEAAPKIAHRVGEGPIEDVDVDAVRVDERVLVRPGELVPCDGVVLEGYSHVDTARITGEPMPISARAGTALLSGTVNGEGPLLVRVTRISRESQYARIVELVRTAQASKSPLQRVADRYAVWFTPITLVVCALAWFFSGDALRVLAVLVVATPCPLILATPVAVIGGINRAARRHIIIRHGGALEQLASVTTVVFDKTGTLTIGLPRVGRILPVGGFTVYDLLRLAGAVEQGSGHLLARTLVEAAHEAGLSLVHATGVTETPGQGVTGMVGERRVSVGTRRYVSRESPEANAALPEPEGLHACIVVDGVPAGVVLYEDRIRPHAADMLRELRALGIRRTILLSGDHAKHAQDIGNVLGITEIQGDLLPQDKVDAINRLMDAGERVVMVGDGTNDAPALSVATVGIALAGHGGGIAAEAADAVLLVDDPARVGEAIHISRRTMRIAHQSINAGLGLSALFMIIAAFGYIPPTAGALIQEAIDVGVILNALRTSRPARTTPADHTVSAASSASLTPGSSRVQAGP
jgi:heavy metal translocating P-type ATPase